MAYNCFYDIKNNLILKFNLILWPAYIHLIFDVVFLFVFFVNVFRYILYHSKKEDFKNEMLSNILLVSFILLKSFYIIFNLIYFFVDLNNQTFFFIKIVYFILLIVFLILNKKLHFYFKTNYIQELKTIEEIERVLEKKNNQEKQKNKKVETNIPGFLKKSNQNNFKKIEKLNFKTKKKSNKFIAKTQRNDYEDEKFNTNPISSREKFKLEFMNKNDKLEILDYFNKAIEKKNYNLIIPKTSLNLEKNKNINQNIIETQRNLGKEVKIIDEKEEENSDEEADLCQICYMEKINSIIMDCGHGGLCLQCAKDIWTTCKNCFLCKKPIQKLLKTKEISSKLVQVTAYYLLNPDYISVHLAKYKY